MRMTDVESRMPYIKTVIGSTKITEGGTATYYAEFKKQASTKSVLPQTQHIDEGTVIQNIYRKITRLTKIVEVLYKNDYEERGVEPDLHLFDEDAEIRATSSDDEVKLHNISLLQTKSINLTSNCLKKKMGRALAGLRRDRQATYQLMSNQIKGKKL